MLGRLVYGISPPLAPNCASGGLGVRRFSGIGVLTAALRGPGSLWGGMARDAVEGVRVGTVVEREGLWRVDTLS